MDEKLFEERQNQDTSEPLSFRMRPVRFDDFVGQEHILSKDKALRKLIESDGITSAIFYGPPGCGKTALAFLIAGMTKKHFVSLNAITATVADVRKIIEDARWRKKQTGKKTILFIDEISHFNKLQQDALMPEVENGTIILIGATTHNPFFSINRALVSRSNVFEFKPLKTQDIKKILQRAIVDKEKGLGNLNISITDEALETIARFSDGDARKALNILELASIIGKKENRVEIDNDCINQIITKKYIAYDREDQHYDTISAFIKSIRGSDPDASVYWLAKMLASGEDPAFIARRLVIAASEDIGNADPMAIVVATSALDAVEHIGMPEAKICLAQATIYLATAPKSNACYLAIESAMQEIEKHPTQEVPEHLKSTGYSGAEKLGHGKGYLYPHDFPEKFVPQKYMEKKISFYKPTDSGYERRIKIFLQRIEALKKNRGSTNEK